MRDQLKVFSADDKVWVRVPTRTGYQLVSGVVTGSLEKMGCLMTLNSVVVQAIDIAENAEELQDRVYP